MPIDLEELRREIEIRLHMVDLSKLQDERKRQRREALAGRVKNILETPAENLSIAPVVWPPPAPPGPKAPSMESAPVWPPREAPKLETAPAWPPQEPPKSPPVPVKGLGIV